MAQLQQLGPMATALVGAVAVASVDSAMAVAASPVATAVAATTRHGRLSVRVNSAHQRIRQAAALAQLRCLPPPGCPPGHPVGPLTHGCLLLLPIQLVASLYIGGWCLFYNLREGSNYQGLSARKGVAGQATCQPAK